MVINHHLWFAALPFSSKKLFMANKTGVATRLHTGIVNAGSFVALGAIIHFHAIPAIVLKPTDTIAPNIAAVTGDSVFLVGFETVGSSDVAVTGDAIHLGTFNMSRMGKEYAIRLARVN